VDDIWKRRPGVGETKRTIDFIFYDDSVDTAVDVVRVLDVPEDTDVGPARLPGLYYPSDHMSLAVDLRLTLTDHSSQTMLSPLESYVVEDPVFRQSLSHIALQSHAFFLTAGILVLGFEGFPEPLVEAKARINAFAKENGYRDENRGSRWAKVTLGAVTRHHTFTVEEATRLRDIMLHMESALRQSPMVVCRDASLVVFRDRALIRRLRVRRVPFEGKADIPPSLGVHADMLAYTESVLEENYGKELPMEQFMACINSNTTLDVTHYTVGTLPERASIGRTLVLDLRLRESDELCKVLQRFRTIVDSDPLLPKFTWLPREVLHCTIRAMD